MVARRPPPLQLKYDNFRLLSMVQQSPAIVVQQKKSFLQQLYKVNWRKVVIAVALLNAHVFYRASTAFQDAIVDHVDHHYGLAQMSLIICLLYLVVAVVETFGVVCIFTRRLALVRIYTYLAFASAFFVAVAGVISAVIFFGFSNEIIGECASLATKGKLHLRSTFQGQPWPIKQLGAKKAYKLCVAAWAHESSFQAISLFAFTIIPTAICLSLIYTYYRQVTDRNHNACLLSSVPPTGRGGIQLEGGNRGNYARVGITSARQDNQASTQRRRVVPTQTREKDLAKAKQARQSESFTTSQAKRLVQINNPSGLVAQNELMSQVQASQQFQMSSPVTWYRITNVVVALGFAVAKYTIHGGKISTVDFAGGVSTGVVLYVLGWWEKAPRLQWYFEPDGQAQLAKLKGLIPKVVSIYVREIICVLLLMFQIPVILMLAGIRLYQGESDILRAWRFLSHLSPPGTDTLIYAGIGVLFVFPSVWTLL
ncbi:hypothetical protein JOM56_004371 [Amanita muscaria]